MSEPVNPAVEVKMLKDRYLHMHAHVAMDVVEFFKCAPAVAIKQVRDKLLEEGFELQFGIAETVFIEPQTPDGRLR